MLLKEIIVLLTWVLDTLIVKIIIMKKIVQFLIAVFLFSSCSNSNKPSDINTSKTVEIPKESIYNVADTFYTQNNEKVTLNYFLNKPTVVGMIFTNCSYACPRLTSDMTGIENNLKEDDGKINYVMVSFDTERDTPEQLKKFADEMKLGKNWTLLTGSENAVRSISVLLNVQFEKDAEGDFSHSNKVSVLDKKGVLKFQKEGLEEDHKETISVIKKLL